jgi:hypothetical protein
VRSRHLLLGVGGVALCAWCAWVSAFHRSTVHAEITWVISLGAVVAVDFALWLGAKGSRYGWRLEPVGKPWPRPGRGGGRLVLRGVAPWILIVAVTLAWDVLGLDTGPHQHHVTISALAQAYRPLNAALLLVWIVAGIGYEAARARAPGEVPDSRVNVDPDPTQSGAAFGAGMLTLGGHRVVPGLLVPASPPIGIVFWVAVAFAVLLVDLTARHSDGRVATAEELIRFVSTARAAHVALIAAWVFAGYHLFAR